jgi:hypothetical protein
MSSAVASGLIAAMLQDLYASGSGVRRELAHCRQGGGENAKANTHALQAWQKGRRHPSRVEGASS